MASVGQYMTGYPTNVSQMGMNSNAQMRYQLPGDPNKMLSSGRHKKEVKRRTKTGCLTCRKRRIKVCNFEHEKTQWHGHLAHVVLDAFRSERDHRVRGARADKQSYRFACAAHRKEPRSPIAHCFSSAQQQQFFPCFQSVIWLFLILF
jgi:hypothetical protein